MEEGDDFGGPRDRMVQEWPEEAIITSSISGNQSMLTRSDIRLDHV
jgi:hypothetical protein